MGIKRTSLMEYCECFYGSVLVACQAYAVGTVKDINEYRKAKNEPVVERFILYHDSENQTLKYSDIDLINSLANYFKHNEEWKKWPNNPTTKTLKFYGINELTENPLHVGTHLLVGDSGELRYLCQLLETWRDCIIRTWCQKST